MLSALHVSYKEIRDNLLGNNLKTEGDELEEQG
jgi:hypothetical protein